MTIHPGAREVDVVLRDGSTVHVCPVKPFDAPAVTLLLKGYLLEAGGGAAASWFLRLRAKRARPAGPAESSALHNFARSGPTVAPADLDALNIHPSMRLRISHYLEHRSAPYIG